MGASFPRRESTQLLLIAFSTSLARIAQMQEFLFGGYSPAGGGALGRVEGRMSTGPLALLAALMRPLMPSAAPCSAHRGALADAVPVPPLRGTPQSSRWRRG